LIGTTELAIQAAIDYAANVGGGVVEIGSGVYDIRTSVKLRSGVHLVGTSGGGGTVFRKAPEASYPLANDADLHESEFRIRESGAFRPGQTVTIRSDKVNWFGVTVATVVREAEGVYSLDRPIESTVWVRDRAVVLSNFPVIWADVCSGAGVRHIEIDGNKAANSFVEGCRNGGIYLYRSSDVVIEHCTVRDYNGDGISYQRCEDIVVRRCSVLDNGGKGIHPGGGNERTRIEENTIRGNAMDGIFLCWRVRNSVVEGNDSSENGLSGFSVGHKDTHNVIANNRFARNRAHGIYFRHDLEPASANYNRFEGNVLVDNGSPEKGYVGIRIDGNAHDIDFVNNAVLYEHVPESFKDQTVGLHADESVRNVRLSGNRFEGCAVENRAAEANAS
jgi:parallel beta-helix repeat protein